MLLSTGLPRSALLAALGLAGALLLLRAATKPRRGKPGQKLPPVVKGWSIVHCFEFLTDQQNFLVRCREKYGDTFTLRIGGAFGGVDWTFLCRDDDIQKFLRVPDSKLSLVRAAIKVGKLLFPTDTNTYDERLEKIAGPLASSSPLIAQAVKPEKLRAFVGQIGTFISKTVDELPDKGEVDLVELCRDVVLELTATLLIGEEVARDEAFMRKWIELFTEADPDSFLSASDSLGKLGSVWVDVTLHGERSVFERIRKHMGPAIDSLIEAIIANDGALPNRHEMAHGLAAAYYLRVDRCPEDFRACRHRLINNLFFLTIAALGNTYAGAAWLLYHTLANTNGLGDRVMPELETVLRGGAGLGTLTLEDFDKLKNLTAGIDEITRLYTPGSATRWVEEDFTTTQGYTIPEGTIAAVSGCVAMRNPEHFPDPLTLDWDRATRGEFNSELYLAWGRGAHPCLGRRLAYMELGVLAAALLCRLDMKLSMPDEALGLEEHFAGVGKHPHMSKGQMAMLWRPTVPLSVSYTKRGDASAH